MVDPHKACNKLGNSKRREYDKTEQWQHCNLLNLWCCKCNLTETTTALITKTYEPTNGQPFALAFREDGWFNMTTAARAFGKRLGNFWNNDEVTAYMSALAGRLNLIPGNPVITHYKAAGYHRLKGVLVETRRGHFTHTDVGSWAHPKLAVFFARWLDVRFAVWCDSVIDDILRGRVVPWEAPQAPSTGLQVLIDGVHIREVLKAVSRGLDDLSEQCPGHDKQGGQSEHHKGSQCLSV